MIRPSDYVIVFLTALLIMIFSHVTVDKDFPTQTKAGFYVFFGVIIVLYIIFGVLLGN